MPHGLPHLASNVVLTRGSLRRLMPLDISFAPDGEHPLGRQLDLAARLLALAVAAFGAAGFALGWLVSPLASPPWWPSVGAALFLVLTGTSLLLFLSFRNRPHLMRVQRLFALAAAGIVLAALLAAVLGDGGIGPEASPPSPLTVAASLLASLSLVTLGRTDWLGFASWLAGGVIFFFGQFFLIDYLYAFGAVDYTPLFRPLSVTGAIAYSAFGIGLMLADSSQPLVRILSSRGPGGLIVRRMLLPAIALPLLLLWLFRIVVAYEVLPVGFGYSLVTTLLVTSLAVLVLYQGSVLNYLAATARRQLAQAEADYLRRIGVAIEAAELYLWEVDFSNGRVYHSDNYVADLGYEPNQATSYLDWWSRIIDPEDLQRVMRAWRQLAGGEQALFQTELRMRRKQGDIRWMYLRARAVESSPGSQHRLIVGVLMDITDRRLAAQRLAEARAKLQMAMDIASVGYWEQDLKTGEVYYSPEWKRLLGFEDAELGNDLNVLMDRVHPDDRAAVLKQFDAIQAAKAPHYALEFRLRHRDGGYRWIASQVLVVRDAEGAPERIHVVHKDISDRKEIEDRIRQVSQHDPLTGLPNRALVHEFAEPMLAAARRNNSQVAVLFIDMDRFKPINDQHGHEVGDKVLIEIARRLRASVRGTDLVGRLGGDEFVVVLADTRSEEAAARVSRVCLERLDTPYRIRGLELHTTASIGISLFPRDGCDIDTLIRHADTAMYEAKHSGRNRYCFFRSESRRSAL